MNNGIEYYYVEVTCKDGIQYGIQGFGEEAVALYNETMNFIEENLDIVNNKRVSWYRTRSYSAICNNGISVDRWTLLHMKMKFLIV